MTAYPTVLAILTPPGPGQVVTIQPGFLYGRIVEIAPDVLKRVSSRDHVLRAGFESGEPPVEEKVNAWTGALRSNGLKVDFEFSAAAQ
jgi:hypothetical protein